MLCQTRACSFGWRAWPTTPFVCLVVCLDASKHTTKHISYPVPVGIQKASTVDRYMGERGPGIAELRSVASRVAS